MNLEAKIDGLYSLPLAEFVAARNALAKELRAGGDREGADEVKALGKPNVPAWAVNRLWHGERRAFDRLLEAGTAVRDAVGAGGGGQEAAARRREAARTLLAKAKKFLSEAGHPTTPSVLQRISHTLDAVVALGVEGLDPPPGRWSRDLEPPGFDFLAGLQLPATTKRKAASAKKTERKPRPAARSTPKPKRGAQKSARDTRRSERIEAARQAVAQSRTAQTAAEDESARLDRELAKAQKAATEATRAVEHAEKAVQRAEKTAALAKAAERETAKTARAARTAASRARAKVTAAENRLAKLAG